MNRVAKKEKRDPVSLLDEASLLLDQLVTVARVADAGLDADGEVEASAAIAILRVLERVALAVDELVIEAQNQLGTVIPCGHRAAALACELQIAQSTIEQLNAELVEARAAGGRR